MKLSKKQKPPRFKRKNHLFAIILIAVAGIIVYANTFGNEFVWDDQYLIIENPYIKNWSHILRIFTVNLFHARWTEGNYYRPMQSLSYILDYSLWRLNPFGYHLTNLLFHLFNSILIYLLVNLFSKDRRVSLITSLFFVVHPLHTAAVTYIAGRADPMATFFFLSSFLLFIKHTHYLNRRGIYCYLGSLLVFGLALLSKEMTIILPLVLCLYYFSFERRSKHSVKEQGHGETFRPVLSHIACRIFPFFVIVGIYIALRLSILNFSSKSIFVSEGSLYLRFLTMCKVIFSYFRLLFFPIGLHMERQMPIVVSLFEPTILISIAGLIFIGIGIFYSYRHSKVVFFSSLWFFITLLPMSNIVLLLTTLIAEHWLYIPSIGFFTLLALGIVRGIESEITVFSPEFLRRSFILLLILIIVFWSLRTIRRNIDWKDELTIFQETLKFSPHNSRVRTNLGLAYHKKGLYDEAIAEYRKALSLNPDNSEIHTNLGLTYFEQNNLTEAITEYKKALSLNPGDFKVYLNLGNISFKQNKLTQAIVEFKKAINLSPDYDNAYYNLGNVYSMQNNLTQAIVEYEKAIKLNPDHAQAHNNLGNTYYRQGKLSKAEVEYKKALSLNPNLVETRYNLGGVYYQLSQYDEAMNNLKTAIDLSRQQNKEALAQKAEQLLKQIP